LQISLLRVGALTVSRLLKSLHNMESASTDGSRVTAIVETEAVRARDEILAIVAHDLRTPLSAIATAASLLTSIDALNPDPDRIRHVGVLITRSFFDN
jgi:K+-sensing histidine kinase KdpD